MSDASFNPSAKLLSPWWILIGMIGLSCLYLPTLSTRFDFIDDGNLVYPAGPMPLGNRLELVWSKIVSNVQHLGPFRPVLWAHWEAEAELFHAHAFAWRCARLFWLALAAGALLWLFRELRIGPAAALLTAALAMWNPYRAEIWTSLTLSEGVAMPYAIGGLVCAIRAARSRRPLPWDVAGALCVLVALGCKNTFVALVPAQVLLRIAPDGTGFREGWRQHGFRACLLPLTLLLPVCHYVYFKLHWHAGQYEMALTGAQFVRMLTTIKGALGLDFLAPGLLALILALYWHGMLTTVWQKYRGACLAGLVLLVSGFIIYLPMSGVAGRYSMPAIWGADLIVAALLSTLAEVPALAWKRAAYGLVACGLAAVAVANLGKQEKFAARADLLWQALEYVERTVPAGSCLAWAHGPALNGEEGIHFCWHLLARGRGDLALSLIQEDGQKMNRVELSPTTKPAAYLVTGSPEPPPGGPWQALKEFAAFYRWGKQGYYCYLWTTKRVDPDPPDGDSE